MRHATARQYDGLQSERSHGAGHGLTESVAAFHGRLRRQVSIDINRQHRAGMTEMSERNADGVVDFCRRGECRIEILPVQLPYQLEGDFGRNIPMKFSAGKLAGRFATDMNRN